MVQFTCTKLQRISVCPSTRSQYTHVLCFKTSNLVRPKGSIIIGHLKFSVRGSPVPSVRSAWLPVPPQPVDRFQNGEGNKLESQKDNITHLQLRLFVSKMQAYKDIDNRQKECQAANPPVIPIPVLSDLGFLRGA